MMYRLLILILIIQYHVVFTGKCADTPPIEDLIVEIEVTNGIKTEKAIGMMYAAKNGILTIITVYDPFYEFSDKKLSIWVSSDRYRMLEPAFVYWKDQLLNIAVLRLSMPDNFVWPEGIKSTDPKDDDIVYIYDRFGNKTEFTERTTGFVNKVDTYKQFEIVSGTMEYGKPGAIVVNNGKIVGMTTNDMGKRIVAIPYKRFHYFMMTKLGIENDNYYIAYPSLLLGAKANIQLIPEAVFQKYDLNTIPHGIYGEIGFSNRFSFRGEYEFPSAIKSRWLPINEQYTQTKTELYGYSISLSYKERAPIGERSIGYVSIGFSRIHQKLFLKMNNDNWEAYENDPNSGETIPKFCNFLVINGQNRFFITDKLILDATFGFKFANKNHLLLNPLTNDLEKNWMTLYLGLGVGYLLFNKNNFRNYVYHKGGL